MHSIEEHPDKNIIRVQLRQNAALRGIDPGQSTDLESHLTIVECNKGDVLLEQGVYEMQQYFVLDGILKRVVSNAEGHQMILRFAAERDMETSYAAWRLGSRTPYSIVAVTKARVARMPMQQWERFLNENDAMKKSFEYLVMQLMSDVMAHTITLHLLDAPGRYKRFMRRQPDLQERLPKKELASYLNLSAETLSRMKQRGKI